MAYKIRYGNSGKTRVRSVKRGKVRKNWVLIALGLFLVSMLFPRGRLWLRNAVVPGDEDVTVGALGELVTDLKEGQPLHDAVSAFCISILTENAA